MPQALGSHALLVAMHPEGAEVVLGVANKAGPKTGEVETCRHWAKGWCMRADACRYANP